MQDGDGQVGSTFSDAEKIACLRLIRTERVGPITYRHLLARYESAENAIDAIPEMASRGGKPLKIASRANAERELETLSNFGADVLFLGDITYPKQLAAIDDAPPVLFTYGHSHLLNKDIIGMVGSRHASAAGVRFSAILASGLAEAGIIVCSGLARGIDGACHQASLSGGTIACIAGGLDNFYPKENRKLQEAIAAEGLIITEAPLGTRPTARHFPRRNRLISGVSLGIVVIEAAKRSGSLITARLAGEQGREVFAVPGSPLDPRAAGTNQLISNGAKLTQNVDDILDELASLRSRPLMDPTDLPLFQAANSEGDYGEARRVILQLLAFTPVPIDEIVRQSDLPAGVVLSIILELELGGVAIRYSGNMVALL